MASRALGRGVGPRGYDIPQLCAITFLNLHVSPAILSSFPPFTKTGSSQPRPGPLPASGRPPYLPSKELHALMCPSLLWSASPGFLPLLSKQSLLFLKQRRRRKETRSPGDHMHLVVWEQLTQNQQLQVSIGGNSAITAKLPLLTQFSEKVNNSW